MMKTLLAGGLLLIGGLAQAASIDVYRDPNCGCCHAWIEHLEENGFEVTDHVTQSVLPLKQQLGITPDLRSCPPQSRRSCLADRPFPCRVNPPAYREPLGRGRHLHYQAPEYRWPVRVLL